MKGKIEISLDDNACHVQIDVRCISKAQIFGIFGALADGFKLNSLDRVILANNFATGVIKDTGATKIELDAMVLDLLEKMKEGSDEG